MQNLGFTRSAFRKDHALLTPDTFVRSPLPGMTRATAIIHTVPVASAAFTQYTAELEGGGSLGPPAAQRFIYVVKGEFQVELAGVTTTDTLFMSRIAAVAMLHPMSKRI